MTYDVIVIGGGHAGCEAAAASSRMGARTALISFSRATIGAMSCNPAIGGLGKGHLVREVDALDGLLARAADAASVHYRMLNASKGTAVQGPRIQADRRLFKAAIDRLLGAEPNLEIVEGSADSLVIERGRVEGVRLAGGKAMGAESVVLATGTFLNGKLFCGETQTVGGRVAEPSASSLGQQLREMALPLARLKTGTPPRLDGRTIDWSQLVVQPSDDGNWTFSPLSKGRINPQLFCAVTRTNARTHDVIRASLDRSPLFSGSIEGLGPRYCPSIEDKIHRFGDRDGHQIFLEPEGLKDCAVYPNGISTSLPAGVQLEFLRTIDGLAHVEIMQPGYAVEYDHIDPRALDHGLQLRACRGLFCAGQINGTTGYEEAAAQGLVAGLNAAAGALSKPQINFERHNSYIGVLIDDLVLQGVTEPYRMLTARAEHRLRLRSDNAHTRLTPLGLAVGCIGSQRAIWFDKRQKERDEAITVLERRKVSGANGPVSAYEAIRTEGLKLSTLRTNVAGLSDNDAVIEEIVEDSCYSPYVARLDREVLEISAADSLSLIDVDFGAVPGLSIEMSERLSLVRPMTLGEAERIRGVTPAALSALFNAASRFAA